MPRQKKRVQKQPAVRNIGNRVVLILCALNDGWQPVNGQSSRPQYRRWVPAWLVLRLKEIERMNSDRKSALERWPTGQMVVSSRLEWKLCRLNLILTRFRASPDVRPVDFPSTARRSWRVFWNARGRRPRKFDYEVELVSQILEIAKAGLLRNLRKCDQCGQWMFARRQSADRFCSTTCRDRFHTTNEADKKRRRDWAQQNYQSKKELELGSRKAAVRKGGKR